MIVQEEYQKLVEQVAILKEVAKEYPGKTIENIIIQIEARVIVVTQKAKVYGNSRVNVIV